MEKCAHKKKQMLDLLMMITVQCKPNSKEQVIEKISETDFLAYVAEAPLCNFKFRVGVYHCA
jgi:hypothetical protein